MEVPDNDDDAVGAVDLEGGNAVSSDDAASMLCNCASSFSVVAPPSMAAKTNLKTPSSSSSPSSLSKFLLFALPRTAVDKYKIACQSKGRYVQ